jgi:inhibitor of KinA
LSIKSDAVTYPSSSFSIFPLGDSAITIDLGNCIEEQHNSKALALQGWLRAHPFPGLLDIIMAYSSVTVFYDPAVVAAIDPNGPDGVFTRLKAHLERAWAEVAGSTPAPASQVKRFEIPVCYEGEYAPDLAAVAAQKKLSPEEVIGLHTAIVYRVYMVGFLPGFPYLGTLDERLCMPRKPQPVNVPAGGVGIAGMQTGIYSLNSPGGWQIIGRTPVKLFDPAADPPVRLQAGDQVRFYPVSPEEYRQWPGRPV